MQLDEKERGFSFMREGPLDMRMDPTTGMTAKEIVNHWSEKDLGKLFQEYGEECQWKKAARAIVKARRKKTIETTRELAEILSKAIGRSKKKLHPATLVFQALRIYVNRELESVEKGVKEAIHILAPRGRMGVLSFHRLEDRIVKSLFRAASKPVKKMMEMKQSHLHPMLKLLSNKPLIPSLREARTNRRARSAKLRACEKM
ncbi:MAG: 16S rRNA (cytosine(1402)-N(4))-methyltransferase RsmH [Simkaniaceae bacterium]|nr:16S rRNA (cytosine(1402)-N(4))-methyltransferase RsmH [Simkaniaceae bacterium]